MYDGTRPSDASRSPAYGNDNHFTGSTVDPVSRRELVFESSGELHFVWRCLARRKFSFLRAQPDPVFYDDENGVRRMHTFDLFGVTRKDSLRVYYDFKPERFVESSGILNVQRLIKAQHGTALADRILVRTEKHVPPTRVHDAVTVLRALRIPCGKADDAMARLVARKTGLLSVSALVAESGLEGRGFNALARMYGTGAIEKWGDARFDLPTLVGRPEALAA